MDSAGNLYGAAASCGADNAGVIYELANNSGTYSESVIYTFTGAADGQYPIGDLVMDAKGNLYGSTDEGGGGYCEGGCGSVFQLKKNGTNWTERVLHTFTEINGDGFYPDAGVTLDSKGNLYGTTYSGGTFGDGIVFRLSPQGNNHYKETILQNFYGANDGCNPTSRVVLDTAGNLYGATHCRQYYDGTVYQLKRSGNKYAIHVILQFNYSNEYSPFDETGHLGVDHSGNVYGTTEYGGPNGYGIVFKLASKTFAYSDLHDFSENGTDGYYPYGGVILDHSGNLYGTTSSGGPNGDGTVWQITNP